MHYITAETAGGPKGNPGEKGVGVGPRSVRVAQNVKRKKRLGVQKGNQEETNHAGDPPFADSYFLNIKDKKKWAKS